MEFDPDNHANALPIFKESEGRTPWYEIKTQTEQRARSHLVPLVIF
jgi:hypothetical protein